MTDDPIITRVRILSYTGRKSDIEKCFSERKIKEKFWGGPVEITEQIIPADLKPGSRAVAIPVQQKKPQ